MPVMRAVFGGLNRDRLSQFLQPLAGELPWNADSLRSPPTVFLQAAVGCFGAGHFDKALGQSRFQIAIAEIFPIRKLQAVHKFKTRHFTFEMLQELLDLRGDLRGDLRVVSHCPTDADETAAVFFDDVGEVKAFGNELVAQAGAVAVLLDFGDGETAVEGAGAENADLVVEVLSLSRHRSFV